MTKRNQPSVIAAPIAAETFSIECRQYGRVLVKLLAVQIVGRPDLGRVEIMDGEDKGTSFVLPRTQIEAARAA